MKMVFRKHCSTSGFCQNIRYALKVLSFGNSTTPSCRRYSLYFPIPKAAKATLPFQNCFWGQNDIKKQKPLSCKDFPLSKWRDSNPRPFGPEPNALPNCATPRKAGADNGTRTHDLLITNQPLYQLSYIGISSASYYSRRSCICPALKAIFLHFCFVKREKSRKYPHAESIFPRKTALHGFFSRALHAAPQTPKPCFSAVQDAVEYPLWALFPTKTTAPAPPK